MRRFAAIVGSAAIASGASAQDTIVLDNAIEILVLPVEGVGWVGVESFYDVGFIDEPEGLTQAAHLAEHMACRGAVGDFAEGEAWARLNELGMGNAETMATHTHYDAIVPADELRTVFETEAGHRRGISFDQDLLELEASRCHAEAANVQRAPQAPMYKFALMAANQAWRYDRDEALVVRGLESIDRASFDAFVSDSYAPARLTLVVAGDVTAEDVRALAGETLGMVNRNAPARLEAPAYGGQPARRTMQWDSVAATIVAYEPPSDPADQLLLTLHGALLNERLMRDADLGARTRVILASSQGWPVGPLPFHVYATIGEGADAGETAGAIARWVEASADVDNGTASQIKSIAGYMRAPMVPAPALVRAQATQVETGGYARGDRALGMVLANVALQAGIARALVELYGETAFERIQEMTPEEMSRVVRASLTPDRRFITLLEPLP